MSGPAYQTNDVSAVIMRSLKSWINARINMIAQAIVTRGLRPESAALLGKVQDISGGKDAERAAAEWILRRSLSPDVAELLLARSTEQSHLANRELNAGSRKWIAWLVHEFISNAEDGTLRMPLVKSINSENISASFLNGENIQVMQGTIVSPDSEIGGNTYVGFNCHITKAVIGRYVSIADNTLIGPGEHQLDNISTSSSFYADPYAMLTRSPCVIKDDVWIGASCVVRRGVTVGTGAVIGANSFVNSDVMPFAIMVGSPARCIGHRFPPETVTRILESRWWELSVAQANVTIANLEKNFLNDS